MIYDELVWLGELLFGVGHVSEMDLLITILAGAAITLGLIALPVMLMVNTKYKTTFYNMFLILFLPALFIGMIPSQAAIVHEGRFSECVDKPLTVTVDSANVDTVATYCRYKTDTLDSEWGEWQLKGLELYDKSKSTS